MTAGSLIDVITRPRVALTVFALYAVGCLALLVYLRGVGLRDVELAAAEQARPVATAVIHEAQRGDVRAHIARGAEWLDTRRPRNEFERSALALRNHPAGAYMHRVESADDSHLIHLAVSDGQGGIVMLRLPMNAQLLSLQTKYGHEYVAISMSGFLGLAVLSAVAIGIRARRRRSAQLAQPTGIPEAPPLTARERRNDWLQLAWVLCLSLALFAADLYLPLDNAVAVTYVAVVLFSLCSQQSWHTWLAAGVCTVLTVATLQIEFPIFDMWSELASRTVAVFVIWTVAALGLWQKRVSRAKGRAQAEAVRAQQANLALQEANAALETALERTAETERQLRRGRRLLDAVGQMARVGGWELDVATYTPVWSPEVYRIHELPEDTPVSLPTALSFFPDSARVLVRKTVQTAIDEGSSFDITVPFRTANGRSRWIRMLGIAKQENNVTTRVTGAFQDVTEQHEAQLRYARAARLGSEGHWEYDFSTRLMWLSASFEELLGYEPKERHMTLEELKQRRHPDDAEKEAQAYDYHLATGAIYDVEIRLHSASGEYRWFRLRGAVERDELGRPARFGGTCFEIHREKLMQNELRLIRERLDRAVHGTQDGLWEQNIHTRELWMSPRFRELLGYSEVELPDGPDAFERLLHQEDRSQFEQTRLAHLQTQAPFDVEVRLLTRSGEYRWFRLRAATGQGATQTALLSGSIQDVTREYEAEHALVAATQAAAAANRAKGDFLANMSHEIRTPMNGVLGMTELLLATQLDARQREFADTIRTSATGLLGILNDILDFSKIEAGKLDVERIEMDIRQCVEDVGTLLAVQAAAKNLELIVNVDPAVPEHVVADPHRLRQILVNLVGNAIKFTERGEVAVEVAQLASQGGRSLLNFEVRDSGVGMSPEVLKRLFQPFTQADASTTRHFGGTGLGLSIVRRLVELMGGQISAASSPGVGSTFTFTLPCEPVDTSEMQTTPPVSVRGKRVLVADDNATNRRVLRGQLEPMGLQVATAANGDEALEKLLKALESGWPFDVLVVDEQMPGVDGATLGKRIRAIPSLNELRLVMLTSLDRSGNAARLDSIGFAGYLVKPARGGELRACIARVLANDVDSGGTGRFRRLVTRGTLVAEQAHALDNCEVLVVEDQPINQEVARRFLERLGCKVTVVSDGAKAVDICSQRPFNIVLMDVQMPVMDGLTATREIRAREPSGQHLPIVALTASAMPGELERCLAAGMDGLLTKPLEHTRLRDALLRYSTPITATVPSTALQTPAVAEGAPDPIDLPKLRAAIGNDDEFTEKICRTFTETATDITAQLERAVAVEDRVSLISMAHKLNGTSNTIYAKPIGQIAATLEREGATHSIDELHSIMRALKLAVEACDSFVKDRFN